VEHVADLGGALELVLLLPVDQILFPEAQVDPDGTVTAEIVVANENDKPLVTGEVEADLPT